MKRKHIRKHPNLYRIYSFFRWKRCCKCGQEFRRERGWRCLDVPIRGHCYTEYYLCKTCAPDYETANKYFLNREWSLPPKPEPPQSCS